MRTLLVLALVLGACGPSDRARARARSDAPAATSSMRGPDLLVLRFSRAGGAVKALAYPETDSVVWRSTVPAPALDRILAFDDDAGSVAAVDTKGAPVRIDLRLGSVSRDQKVALANLVSGDGSSVYGISKGGLVSRLTPSGNDWTFKPPRPASAVFPQPDGSILVLANAGTSTMIWHLHPPMMSISDTAVLPRARRAIGTQVGDRLYFTVDSGLIGVRSRDLSSVPSVRFDRPVIAVATTPSGDRIYVATEDGEKVVVVDRYSHEVDARIVVPGQPADLRMDATGRYVLVRPAEGDSAWVIAVGTDKMIGSVETEWRDDLPVVAPDGSIVLLRGRDVVIVDGETLAPRRTVPRGADDIWLFIAWNGFRPRAAGLDQPVTFADNVERDSMSAENPFSEERPGREAQGIEIDSAPAMAPASPVRITDSSSARSPGFIVQFAALRSEEAARKEMRNLAGSSPVPRIVVTSRDGITIYRVVLGPFPTREDAERVARASGTSYWIYEGAP